MILEALPEFFQTTGNTLLDQLDDFEIGGVDDMDIQKSKVLVNDELTIESLNVLNFGIGEPKSNNNSDVVALDEHLSEPLRSIPETPPLVRPYHPPNSSMMKSSDLRYQVEISTTYII